MSMTAVLWWETWCLQPMIWESAAAGFTARKRNLKAAGAGNCLHPLGLRINMRESDTVRSAMWTGIIRMLFQEKKTASSIWNKDKNLGNRCCNCTCFPATSESGKFTIVNMSWREQIDTLFYIYKTHTNQIQSKTGWTNRLKHKKFRCLQYHEF